MTGTAPGRGSRTPAEGESQRLWRLAGMGGTLASEIVAGLLLGWLADTIFGTKPTLLVVGTVMGVVVGMVTFIRRAIAETRQATREAALFTRTRDATPPPADTARDDHDAPEH